MAPRAGFEPATNRLTVDCSTAELSRNIKSWPKLKGQPCFVNCHKASNLTLYDLKSPPNLLKSKMEARAGIEPAYEVLQTSA